MIQPGIEPGSGANCLASAHDTSTPLNRYTVGRKYRISVDQIHVMSKHRLALRCSMGPRQGRDKLLVYPEGKRDTRFCEDPRLSGRSLPEVVYVLLGPPLRRHAKATVSGASPRNTADCTLCSVLTLVQMWRIIPIILGYLMGPVLSEPTTYQGDRALLEYDTELGVHCWACVSRVRPSTPSAIRSSHGKGLGLPAKRRSWPSGPCRRFIKVPAMRQRTSAS